MGIDRDLAKTFAEQYAALIKEKGDQLTLTDVRLVVEDLTERNSESVYDRIFKIALKLHHLKDEFCKIDTDKVASDQLPKANMRLEAVVQATEKATNTILDAAQKIQGLAAEAGDKTKSQIEEQITQIFEACNFQDLTGQHINKVLKTMEDIESLVKAIVQLLPEEFKESARKRVEALHDPNAEPLHGPQLSNEAPSQEDIDRLFASA